MRCARCGNENSDENRFCGMCGANLLTAPAPAPAPLSSAPAPSVVTRSTALPSPASSVSEAPQNVAVARTSASPASESPIISGPSFLGLNEAAPASRRRGGLSIDPGSAPGSGNLDYLLHDEEEETRRGGAGKYVLILLALALAVGLGYLRWKNQGFAQIFGTSKPAAAQNSEVPDASGSAQPANGTSAPAMPPAASPTPATAAPMTATSSAQPTAGAAAGSSAAGATTNPNPANLAPPPSSPPAQPAAAPANAATSAAAPDSSAPASPAPDSTTESATAQPVPAAKQPVRATSAALPTTDPNVNRGIAPPTSKPSAALKPAKAFDPVSEAQKYIYGRGVGQDCDRGMRLLKPAADQANPKAMIEMGALYSAGLCTPHDLPTAYRWFALALRKDPDNQSVQSDLEKLWGEMTQPERQLAIKLSQ